MLFAPPFSCQCEYPSFFLCGGSPRGREKEASEKKEGCISGDSDPSRAEKHTATTQRVRSLWLSLCICHKLAYDRNEFSRRLEARCSTFRLSGQNAGVGKAPPPPETLGRIGPLPLPAFGRCDILCLWPSLQSLRRLHIAFSSVHVTSLPLPHGDTCGWI